jgi:invasion protein IalB
LIAACTNRYVAQNNRLGTSRMFAKSYAGYIPAAFLFMASAHAAERITFEDWVFECSASKPSSKLCQLRQTLSDGAGKRVVEFAVKRADKSIFLEVVTPLSISIPYGVALIVMGGQSAPAPDPWAAQSTKSEAKSKGAQGSASGAKAKTEKQATPAAAPSANETVIPLQLASCDPDGCRAVTPLDEKSVAQIKAASRLAVRFQDSKTGKLLTINGSPKGFAEGSAMVSAAP